MPSSKKFRLLLIIYTNPLLLETDLTAKFNYYSIYKSPYIQNSPFVDEDFDTEVFDGIRLIFGNDWDIEIPDSKINWKPKISLKELVEIMLKDEIKYYNK